MTKELQNLLSLLESPSKENRDLGAVLAQNYKDEFKMHFGYEIAEYQELITFLAFNTWDWKWDFEVPIVEIENLDFYLQDLEILPECLCLLLLPYTVFEFTVKN